jgi:FHS family Na+ dependent glucose MFS transporter 1
LETKAISIKHALRAGTGRLSRTSAYYLAFIALGTAGAVLGPTKQGLANNTQTQLNQISILFTAGSLGYLLGSLLSGRLFDRTPGHPIMAAGLILMAAMLGLAPLAPLLGLLIALFLFLGMAQAAVDVGGNTLLVWTYGDQVPPFMSGLHFFFGLGAFLSPLIIGLVVALSGGISWAFWALAILMLPAAIWLLGLPSPALQGDTQTDVSRPVDNKLLALLVIFFFLHVGAELSFGGWIFDYGVAMGLTRSSTSAFLLNSAFWGALTLGRLLTVPAATRLRPSTILLGGLVGCLVSLGIILGWPTSSVALWLGTIGMGLSIAPMFPTGINLAERRMGITGQVTSWFLVGASLGSMTVPWLIGQWFESVGAWVAMIIILIDITLALGVFLVIKFGFSPAGPDSGEQTTRPI